MAHVGMCQVRCVAVVQCGLRWLLGSLDSWPQGALCSLHDEVVVVCCDDVGVVLGVSPMPEPVRSSLQGPWCLTGDLCWVARSLDLFRKVHCAQVMLSAMVLSLGLIGSTVICDGCPGPWILVRKVLCARVASATVLSLRWCGLCDGVVSAMAWSLRWCCLCDDVVSAMVWSLRWCCLRCLRIHDVAQAVVVTEVLWSGSCCPRVTPASAGPL